MRKKIVNILVCMLMIMSAFVISNNPNIKAEIGEGDEETSLFDTDLIREVAEELSEIVNRSYDVDAGEIAKGRAFGTQGELDARDYVKDIMDDILGEDNVTLDKIERVKVILWHNDLDDKLEVTSKEMSINGEKVDCYISPRWKNDTYTFFHNPSTENFSYDDLVVKHRPTILFEGCLNEAIIVNDLNIFNIS